MQIPALKAERRAVSGTKAMRKLRATGRLPGVLYGSGKENINIALDTREIEGLLAEASHVVQIDIEGDKQYALMRALQRNHLGDVVQHIDFVRLALTDKVKLRVPMTFVGTPKGASKGGLLEILNGDVEIKCPADRIPKFIEVEVTRLNVGENIYFKDLPLPEGAELIPNPDGIVVKCAQARRAAALARTTDVEEAGMAAGKDKAAAKPAAKK